MNPITPTYDPATLNIAQRDGLACVTCGHDDKPMRPVGALDGVQVFACVDHDQPTARARTEAAMRSLNDIVAGGDFSVRPEFAAAVIAQVNAMHAEMDHLRAELAELGGKSKNLADDALKAFRWGWLAAWQLASELDMGALDVARTALDETTRAPFTADEQRRLMAVLFDIADERQGFKPWKPAPMPFDHEGRCDDVACLSCYPIPAQRVESV